MLNESVEKNCEYDKKLLVEKLSDGVEFSGIWDSLHALNRTLIAKNRLAKWMTINLAMHFPSPSYPLDKCPEQRIYVEDLSEKLFEEYVKNGPFVRVLAVVNDNAYLEVCYGFEYKTEFVAHCIVKQNEDFQRMYGMCYCCMEVNVKISDK